MFVVTANAAIVTFNLRAPTSGGTAGTTLNSNSSVTIGGITLTVSAIGSAGPGSFSAITANAGVDSVGVTGEETSRLDLGEQLNFTVTFSDLNVQLLSVDWNQMQGDTAADAAIFELNNTGQQSFYTSVANFNGTTSLWSVIPPLTINSGDVLKFSAADQVGLQQISFNANAVPEPSSLLLLSIGGGILGLTRRRRNRRMLGERSSD
jgi:hypothetical protein